MGGAKGRASAAREAAFIGVFAALAAVAGYAERLLPSPVAVPGIKLGVANVVILVVLFLRGGRAAALVNFTRIVVTGLLFGGFSAIVYSLCGAAAAMLAMLGARRAKIFGAAGVGAAGGVFHNAGQILIAAAVVSNAKLLYYLPALIVSGTAAGVITGLAAWLIAARLKKLSQTADDTEDLL